MKKELLQKKVDKAVLNYVELDQSLEKIKQILKYRADRMENNGFPRSLIDFLDIHLLIYPFSEIRKLISFSKQYIEKSDKRVKKIVLNQGDMDLFEEWIDGAKDSETFQRNIQDATLFLILAFSEKGPKKENAKKRTIFSELKEYVDNNLIPPFIQDYQRHLKYEILLQEECKDKKDLEIKIDELAQFQDIDYLLQKKIRAHCKEIKKAVKKINLYFSDADASVIRRGKKPADLPGRIRSHLTMLLDKEVVRRLESELGSEKFFEFARMLTNYTGILLREEKYQLQYKESYTRHLEVMKIISDNLQSLQSVLTKKEMENVAKTKLFRDITDSRKITKKIAVEDFLSYEKSISSGLTLEEIADNLHQRMLKLNTVESRFFYARALEDISLRKGESISAPARIIYDEIINAPLPTTSKELNETLLYRGLIYAEGFGNYKVDMDQAIDYFHRAIEQGSNKACIKLAEFYYSNISLELFCLDVNFQEAKKKYLNAFKQEKTLSLSQMIFQNIITREYDDRIKIGDLKRAYLLLEESIEIGLVTDENLETNKNDIANLQKLEKAIEVANLAETYYFSKNFEELQQLPKRTNPIVDYYQLMANEEVIFEESTSYLNFMQEDIKDAGYDSTLEPLFAHVQGLLAHSLYGIFGVSDPERAKTKFKYAAENGFSMSYAFLGDIDYQNKRLESARHYLTLGIHAGELDCIFKLDEYFLQNSYNNAMEKGQIDAAWSLLQQREDSFTKALEQDESWRSSKVKKSLDEIKKLQIELATSPDAFSEFLPLVTETLQAIDNSLSAKYFTTRSIKIHFFRQKLSKTLKENLLTLHPLLKNFSIGSEPPSIRTFEKINSLLDQILAEPSHRTLFPKLNQLEQLIPRCQRAIETKQQDDNPSKPTALMDNSRYASLHLYDDEVKEPLPLLFGQK